MWHLCLLAHKRLRRRKRFGERDVEAVKKKWGGKQGGWGAGNCSLGHVWLAGQVAWNLDVYTALMENLMTRREMSPGQRLATFVFAR